MPTCYRLLLAAYGPQGWWPGETPFEVAVGAILTQNTAWTNVEKAIANLRRAGALSFRGMKRLPERKLAALIRPSGYYNQKAKKLRAFLEWLKARGGKTGSVRRALAGPLDDVRASLLAVHGVGPETADSILLYAGDRPVFVIDAYTRRVLARHGMPAATGAPYEELRALFESNLPRSAPLYNEFHALFVRLAKERCAKRKPDCAGCPLRRALILNHRGHGGHRGKQQVLLFRKPKAGSLPAVASAKAGRKPAPGTSSAYSVSSVVGLEAIHDQ